MVFPHEHLLIRFNGHFGTSGAATDKWSSGIRLGLPGGAPVYDAAKLQTLVNACQAAAKTFHTTTGVNAGTNCFLDYTSGAQIGVSGRYEPSTQLTIVSPTDTTASFGSPLFPFNTAQVISLRTTQPRGRASNGRVYWPMLAGVLDTTTGRMSPAGVNTRLVAFKTMLDSINTAANTYFAGTRVIVASAVGGGLIATVTSIRADGRMDSIERRENDLPSVYSTATLA